MTTLVLRDARLGGHNGPRDVVLRDDVVLSHDNAPNQSMICGPEDAVHDLVLSGADVRAKVFAEYSRFLRCYAR